LQLAQGCCFYKIRLCQTGERWHISCVAKSTPVRLEQENIF
jgi:hypothetical protein